MTKIINLGTSAFYELQEATKKAKISFDGFETAISKVFPKQAKKEKSIKDKISDLNVKRLGFCGVYAQSFFHAIEPNRCYLQFFFNN